MRTSALAIFFGDLGRVPPRRFVPRVTTNGRNELGIGAFRLVDPISGHCGGTVGRWPDDGLAKVPDASGGRPKPTAVLRDVVGGWHPPPGERMRQRGGGSFGSPTRFCGGPPPGELGGGNWIVRTAHPRLRQRGCLRAGRGDSSRRPDRYVLFGSAHRGDPRHRLGDAGDDSYLVDSASSHMLVSRIKPCMSKYKQSIP